MKPRLTVRFLSPFIVLLIGFAYRPFAIADEPARPNREQVLKQVMSDLLGNDPAKSAAALDQIRAVLSNQNYSFSSTGALDAMLAAKKFGDVEALCEDATLANAQIASTMAMLQKYRALALLGMDKPDQALACAKSYYNVATLQQTRDAIETMATCLSKARPQENGIGRRFKRQQVGVQGDDLGQPILPTIKVDSQQYDEVIDLVEMDGKYRSLEKKGNLLLLADRPADARKVFAEALAVAADHDYASAAENVARAIRDETGSVPAINAYILSLRNDPSAK